MSKSHKKDESSIKIFFCYAKEDKSVVRRLYKKLAAKGFSPWMDDEVLLPGSDWELEIKRAIRTADYFLVFLSRNSIDKRGYVQKEIREGLDVLDQMPQGRIFLIPVRLEECLVPEQLSTRQWVDVFTPDGISKLTETLTKELPISPKPGKIYIAKVVRIRGDAAFVDIGAGIEGMIPRTEIADFPIGDYPIRDFIKPKDEVLVMILYINKQGGILLSRRAVLEGFTLRQAREAYQKGKNDEEIRKKKNLGRRSSDKKMLRQRVLDK